MLKIQFETGNEAYAGASDFGAAVADTLRQVAQRIEVGDFSGCYQNVKDINGNVVGTFRLRACDCPDGCGCAWWTK